ncbi:MAG: pyrroline-5-carboxylate reductase [Eubacteriales bacterium]|nr:pyrroline-5-carboxylate reductase [Eubacteriales bacterium]
MRLAVIGIGNMGQALVRGFIRGGVHKPEEIMIYDSQKDKAKEFAGLVGCVYCEDIRSAVEEAQAVMMAVKPQTMEVASTEVAGAVHSDALIISIAAGKTISKLRQYFGERKGPFCRVMPNTPALVGQGASALCFESTTIEQENYCLDLFKSCGIAVRVREDQMNAVTAVSGSGPAYGMILVEEMAKAGIELGLDRDVSLQLAAETLKGAASLISQTGEEPEVLTARVCSPGGTTLAAVGVLESGGFRETIREAVYAAAKRSGELAQ